MTATIGEQLKFAGIEANLAAATAINRTYREHAERVLLELARSGREFSAEDIRDRIPAGVEPHHPNVLPSVIGSAAAQRLIYPVGRRNSPRPTRHAARISLYKGTHLVLLQDAT